MILNINFRIEKKNPAINNSNIPFFYFLHYLNSIFFWQQPLIQSFVKAYSLLRPRNNKMENRKTRRKAISDTCESN